MKHHIPRGNVTRAEYRRFVSHTADGMSATIKFSNELYGLFPDIIPVELKSDPDIKARVVRTPKKRKRSATRH
jgi:membrane-bound lytic murein transglycosylase